MKLGDVVELTYNFGGSYGPTTIGTTVGRPVSENDNGQNQLKHDIRELKARAVVFSKHGSTQLSGAIGEGDTIITVASVAIAHESGTLKIGSEFIGYTGTRITNDPTTNVETHQFTGCSRGIDNSNAVAHPDNSTVLYSITTPATAKTLVEDDLNTIDERFAQAGIRLKRPVPIEMGGVTTQGVVLPNLLLDGFTPQLSFMQQPNADEAAVIALKDGDPDTLDIFYVQDIRLQGVPGRQGESYPAVRNRTGDPANQNFFVLQASHHDLVPPHEVMHILRNSPHRIPGEPSTSLLYFEQGPAGAPNPKSVLGPKRIGPYPDSTTSGVGSDDTFFIRGVTEYLP